MRARFVLLFIIIASVGCKSTEQGLSKDDRKLYDIHRSMSTWDHLSDSELALMLLGRTCFKTYLVLTKYKYEIESVSTNEIVYRQPDGKRVTSSFDTSCPDSILRAN